jgi:hypothetical protein
VPRARAALAHRDGPRHLLFAFTDHYEPLWNNASPAQGVGAVQAWHKGYPEMVSPFRDADGKPPRHSFFYPGRAVRGPRLPGAARPIWRAAVSARSSCTFTTTATPAATLRPALQEYLKLFANHGHLTRDPDGRLRYAFIHGNWALANPMHDGRWCGVPEEVALLYDTGCYADFTFRHARRIPARDRQPDLLAGGQTF